MDYSETRNLSRLGGSIKTSIAQGLPAMSHILVQNLNSVPARWLQLFGMRCRGIPSLKLSFLHALVGGTIIAYVLPRPMVKQGNCCPQVAAQTQIPMEYDIFG